MPRHNQKRGRPQAVKRIRLQVVRRPEEQIDQRQLALALIALERGIRETSADQMDDPAEHAGGRDE